MNAGRRVNILHGTRLPSIQVVYIAGAGFSGSTLLSFLMNSHAQMVCVGEDCGTIPEVKDPLNYLCSCGETLGECGFWRDVGASMHGLGFDFGPSRWDTRFELGRNWISRQLLVRSLRNNALELARDRMVMLVPNYRERLREIAERTVALIQSILEVSGKDIFVSAQKDVTRVRFLLRIPRLKVRVVHLIRDSLGNVCSAMRHRGGSARAAARAWSRTCRNVWRVQKCMAPEDWMDLRYEDLCSDPVAALDRIATFAHVDPFSWPISFRNTDHHVIGNEMRLGSSTEIVLDERWKHQLSQSDQVTVARITRRYRHRYGYRELTI